MFGRNEFGDPLFKIVWGQSEFIRMGNVWRDKHGTERKGYRERYQCHGTPCWVIMRWKSPNHYGSPAMYYSGTFDDFSGMYILGEYPWRGRYEVMQPLARKEFKDGKLMIEHFPLSHVLIDKLIPLMLMAQRMTYWEWKAANDLARQHEEKAQTDEIADRLMDALPKWYGPVSYSRQGCRTALLDRKMHQIQQAWDRLSQNGRRPRFQRGFSTGQGPKQLSGAVN
jgi:hypothetical protein